MLELAGKTAFVTGGASGIGFALGRAFLDAGMNVMLADIEEAALRPAVQSLSNYGPRVAGTLCDVSRREEVQRAAAETFAAYGKVHVVCNNAGVSPGGLIEQIAANDWEWAIGVNLMGVVHGVQAFLPHIKMHGEGGHIVNTSSTAGLAPTDVTPATYAATKFAVIGLTEVLANELKGTNIGASVLCPSSVRTRMVDNGRNRPARFGGGFDIASDVVNAERNARLLAALQQKGLDPDVVAGLVIQAIRANRLYVFTHPERRQDIEKRFARILADYEVLEPKRSGGNCRSLNGIMKMLVL